MNSTHLRAFLWLRWRLFLNQLRRSGIANQVILAIIAVNIVSAAIVFFAGALIAGILLMPTLSAPLQLLIWDLLIFGFFVAWLGGVVHELQRSEALTLDKFLHLPVSLSGVFVLNYLSSLMSLALLFFAPALFGLAAGEAVGSGPAMLVVLPLVAAFIFAATALSYQFQGWLASMMANKRRRRTIAAFVTLTVILLSQSPQLIHLLVPRPKPSSENAEVTQKIADLKQAWEEQKIGKEDFDHRLLELHKEASKTAEERLWLKVQDAAWYANVAFPPCWLALGAVSAAEGNPVPALLATLAFALVGAASLWRAYRTILRLYLGTFTAKQPAAPAAAAAPGEQVRSTVLDRAIPGLSEQAAVIALAGLRAHSRAPEVKMLLLSPVVMYVIAGGAFLRMDSNEVPLAARTLIAIGAIAMTLVMLMQLLANQFGFDRAGFRIFVLSPAPRRDILLGKNLAVAPLAALMTAPFVLVMQFFVPMRIDHILALPGQFTSMYLLYCLWGNALSIIAPMPIASGTLKPANPRGLIFLLYLAFLLLVPILLAPTLLPLAVETGFEALDWLPGVPICLILTYVEAAAIVLLYRMLLGAQGRWLEANELKILEAVTSKSE